jgi:hypothetical protein
MESEMASTGNPATDAAKTQQAAEAELERKAADDKAARAEAPATDDSPKRQGDKLERAAKEAAR